MSMEILTYGVRERRTNNDQMEKKLEELDLDGFTILENIFPVDEMKLTGQLLDTLLDKQIEEMGDRINLQNANDDDLVRCPLGYMRNFLDIAINKTIVDLFQRYLGDNCVLLMQNGVINRPENKQYQVRWHRDLNYQHWTSSKPLAINYLICIDRFYKDGGCTWVLPGSHLHEYLPSEDYIRSHEIPVEADIGSVVVMNAMTFHRSGINITATNTRRAINHVVGLPLLGQQIDIPRFLATNGFDYSSDHFLNKFLGYKWNPSPSPYEWRVKHTKKLTAVTV